MNNKQRYQWTQQLSTLDIFDNLCRWTDGGANNRCLWCKENVSSIQPWHGNCNAQADISAHPWDMCLSRDLFTKYMPDINYLNAEQTSKVLSSSWSMTSPLHGEGLRFDPGWNHFFFSNFFVYGGVGNLSLCVLFAFFFFFFFVMFWI